MENKWQIIIAECERLSDAAGVPLPAFPQPPAPPVGLEWANPWLVEARRLDWLAGYLKKVGTALTREAKPEEEVEGPKAEAKKTSR